MNLKLTKRQAADLIQAVLECDPSDEKKLHRIYLQYGQLDKADEIDPINKYIAEIRKLEAMSEFEKAVNIGKHLAAKGDQE